MEIIPGESIIFYARNAPFSCSHCLMYIINYKFTSEHVHLFYFD